VEQNSAAHIVLSLINRLLTKDPFAFIATFSNLLLATVVKVVKYQI
jgi:hypothetical protein